jgi:hypothetical protein
MREAGKALAREDGRSDPATVLRQPKQHELDHPMHFRVLWLAQLLKPLLYIRGCHHGVDAVWQWRLVCHQYDAEQEVLRRLPGLPRPRDRPPHQPWTSRQLNASRT